VLIAPEKVKINFENIDFVSRAKQMFSAKSLIEFLKSVFKVVLMTSVTCFIVLNNLGDLSLLAGTSAQTLLNALAYTLMQLLVATTLVFILFGAPDLLLQKFLFLRENRMSKDEVFREYKQSEGDPHIKHQRKRFHMELSSSGQKTQNASAVVVNPTHVAVALYYQKVETPLPVVLAKGEGDEARDIVQAARESGIPIVRNIPVARALLADAEVDQFIPHWLIEPVAELLRTVAELAAQGPVDEAEMD
jgi:type III secretion protein U